MTTYRQKNVKNVIAHIGQCVYNPPSLPLTTRCVEKMAHLSLSLLGPFEARLDQKVITDFATDKVRALLVYLAVEADHPHRRDTLAGVLWPDQPQQKARHSLRQAISHLRQVLGERDDGGSPFLLVTRQTVQFNAASDHWLDVAAFKALVKDCKTHRHSRPTTCLPCTRRMQRMAELYQGEFLEQFFLSDSALFEEWALLEREWLHREAIDALSHLVSYYERRGDYAQARQHAWRQVELETWREEAHRHLMRLLALDGQRSAALAQYETCRRVLAEELGVEPANETTTLYERIRAEESLRPPPHPHHVPPSPAPLVGREQELAELTDMLADPDCRLVTLIGPGGIGKTHLALQVAADHIGCFVDGIYFVPLASVSSSKLIISTMADTLRFSFYSPEDTKEQLLNYLHEKEILLVLDNLEHVLDAECVGLLTQILWRAPRVVLLVTSRERLNLQGERTYELKGLSYPTTEDAQGLVGYSAVELFLQKARQAQRHFALTEAEAPHVVRICQITEGIPLGVELATAWVRVHPCGRIAQEIEHNLDILTTQLVDVPERHRSIRATFEHSWQLLSQAEKDLLARLSVFRGGFEWEGAEMVAGASRSTLLALLDKSLIRRTSPDRYDMHALLRQYVAEKLETDPREQEQTQARYTCYFAAFLGRQARRLQGAEQRQALLETALEIENARQAWELCVSDGRVDEVEQSMDSLFHFYDMQCRFQEGVDLLAQATERWDAAPEQAGLFGKALSRQAVLYRHLGLYQKARSALERSLEIFERLGTQIEQVFCLVNLAEVLRKQGRNEQVEQLAQRSLDLSRQIEDCWGIGRSLFLVGAAQYRTGSIGQAQASLEQSLALSLESGNPRLIMSPLNMLGDVACHRGDYDKAQAVFEECLALSRELGDLFNSAVHLNNLGTVLHLLGKYSEARSHYRESLDICRQIGDRGGQAVALSNLGEVAYALGAYAESRKFYQEGLSIGRDIEDQWTIMPCLNNLGEIACTLEEYEGAATYFAEALNIAAETQTLPMLFKVLINLAVLFARQGQTDRAVVLLGLAHRHPACEQADQEKAGRLLDEMGLVPPDRVPRSLDAIVAEILAEIQIPQATPKGEGAAAPADPARFARKGKAR
jgi:predicted ATPase/DNA-binding SARP family transcriptional activator/Tfp pilus assembly protein PilF